LTGKPKVTGSGNGERSGAQVLLLLAAPLIPAILAALVDEPKAQIELRHETGAPAQTTLRAQLKRLVELEAISKSPRGNFPGTLEYELTPGGRELLGVAAVLERWLRRAPDDSLRAGANAPKAAITALTRGWSATILRALAAGPQSLTELDGVIDMLSYPSLERRLAALRLAGQVEAQTGNGRGTPYGVTSWAREGVGPLAAAALWERQYVPNRTPAIGRVDAESLFLLAAPLLSLPEDVSGTCRLGMELAGNEGPRLAGAVVTVEEGRVRAWTSRLQESADAWALGSAGCWLEALVRADTAGIEAGGDGRLAGALLAALQEALFGAAMTLDRPV